MGRTSHLLARNSDVSLLGGIRLAGFEKSGRGVLQKWRTLSSYCLVYVVEGSGRYKDQTGLTFPIVKGDCFISKPDIAHHYGPDNKGLWDEYYVLFEGPVFYLLEETGFFKWRKPTVSLMAFDYWTDRVSSTATRAEGSNPIILMDEVLSLQSLIADINLVSRESLEDDLAWLQSAKNAIIQYTSNHAAADSLGLKHETFRKKFKKLSRKSPGKYRIAVNMETACDLIGNTDMTIKSIAEQLSFCDEFHFSKQFSKLIGVSPMEYRSKTNTPSSS